MTIARELTGCPRKTLACTVVVAIVAIVTAARLVVSLLRSSGALAVACMTFPPFDLPAQQTVVNPTLRS